MGNSTARHIRKALLDGLPADETNDTLEKKKRQRGRDIARREATLLQIEREKPLPRTRSHSLLKPVLRTLIDLGPALRLVLRRSASTIAQQARMLHSYGHEAHEPR